MHHLRPDLAQSTVGDSAFEMCANDIRVSTDKSGAGWPPGKQDYAKPTIAALHNHIVDSGVVHFVENRSASGEVTSTITFLFLELLPFCMLTVSSGNSTTFKQESFYLGAIVDALFVDFAILCGIRSRWFA